MTFGFLANFSKNVLIYITSTKAIFLIIELDIELDIENNLSMHKTNLYKKFSVRN